MSAKGSTDMSVSSPLSKKFPVLETYTTAVSDWPPIETVTGTSNSSAMREGLDGPTFTSNVGPQAYKFLKYCSTRLSRVPGFAADESAAFGAGDFSLPAVD